MDWLEHATPERAREFEEIGGYHLEQAHLILIQLGPLDDHAIEIGLRGAEYLSSAGHRALARGDLHAAASLLRRAAALFPAEDRRRLRHLLEAGEAHIELGEFEIAEVLLTGAIEGAAEHGDRAIEATGKLILLDIRYARTPEDIEEEIISGVQASIAELEGLADHEGLARAWRLLTLVHWEACRWGVGEEAARRMIDHARAAGNSVLEARVLPALATSALYGPRPVPEAIAVCEELLEQTRIDRKGEAVTMRALAHLEAMRGDFDRARDLYRHSRASLEELGWKLHAAQHLDLLGPHRDAGGQPAGGGDGAPQGLRGPGAHGRPLLPVQRSPVCWPRRCSTRAGTTRRRSSHRSARSSRLPTTSPRSSCGAPCGRRCSRWRATSPRRRGSRARPSRSSGRPRSRTPRRRRCSDWRRS